MQLYQRPLLEEAGQAPHGPAGASSLLPFPVLLRVPNFADKQETAADAPTTEADASAPDQTPEGKGSAGVWRLAGTLFVLLIVAAGGFLAIRHNFLPASLQWESGGWKTDESAVPLSFPAAETNEVPQLPLNPAPAEPASLPPIQVHLDPNIIPLEEGDLP